MHTRTERVQHSDQDTISYLKQDIVHNALDIWYLQRRDKRYELYTCRVGSDIKAHLSIYRSPEANYVSLGGDPGGAEELLPLVPAKGILLAPLSLQGLVTQKFNRGTIFRNDIMMVMRGEEKLRNPEQATRLSRNHGSEYSTFGASFNMHNAPLEWVQEHLDSDFIFGVFAEGKLASVASVVAWLPQVSVIMSVETKPIFRGRGLGRVVVSAAVLEGLKHSRSCALFVRVDNEQAIGLYRGLGFKKVGEELWIDIGTGLIP